MPTREETGPRNASKNVRVPGKQATEEQRRMAELISNDTVPDLAERAHQVMEVTRCTEDVAYVALHDSGFNPDQAVDYVLSSQHDEWVTSGVKNKKPSKAEGPGSRRGGMASSRSGFGRNSSSFRPRSENSAEPSSHSDGFRQNGRNGRVENGRQPRGEFRQRTDSSRGSHGAPSRGRGGAFGGRGGMSRASGPPRSTTSQQSVRKADRPSTENETVTRPVVETAITPTTPEPKAPEIQLEEIAKALPPQDNTPVPEPAGDEPIINVVDVPSHCVVVQDKADASQYVYTFPVNKPLVPVGVCRIHRSQIPRSTPLVMPHLTKPAPSADVKFLQSQANSSADGRRMASPERGVVDTQVTMLSHFSTEAEVAAAAAAACPQVEALMRASPPQPTPELSSEPTFPMPESPRALMQQQAALTSPQHAMPPQPHMILQPAAQRPRSPHMHQMPPSPTHSRTAALPPQQPPSPQPERSAPSQPTAVLLRSPSQQSTAGSVASAEAPVAGVAASEASSSGSAAANMPAPATSATTNTSSSYSGSRVLPPGVSTTNPQERSLEESRSAALNAAASLAPATSTASDSQPPSRAPSGSKSAPVYVPNANNFVQPHQQYMPMMPATYSDYDNVPQTRSRMTGMHDGVQTTYQSSTSEQSASTNGVLGPAPSGNMSMLQQQPQQQQQQQQQPMHPYYSNIYGYMYPQMPFPGHVHPFPFPSRNHPYNNPYVGYPPVGLPGYDEEAAGAYQAGSAQGAQVKAGTGNTAPMTSVSSSSVNTDSFKGQNYDGKGIYGVGSAGPYNMPQQSYMHNNAAANQAAMMGRNMPPQVQPGAATHYSQHGMHPGMMDGMQQPVRASASQGGMSTGAKHHQSSNNKYSTNHTGYGGGAGNWQ